MRCLEKCETQRPPEPLRMGKYSPCARAICRLALSTLLSLVRLRDVDHMLDLCWSEGAKRSRVPFDWPLVPLVTTSTTFSIPRISGPNVSAQPSPPLAVFGTSSERPVRGVHDTSAARDVHIGVDASSQILACTSKPARRRLAVNHEVVCVAPLLARYPAFNAAEARKDKQHIR